MGLELFGIASGPYLLLSCTIAFLLSGHRSAIPTQLLQFTKAPALQAQMNQEIGELEIMGGDKQKEANEQDERN